MNTRILIADDHPLFRTALKQTVENLLSDIELLDCADFSSAQRIVEQESIDILLLDLNMPGSQGLAGLAQIKAEHPELAVVIVSANDQPQVIKRAMQLGANGYIPKSSSGDEIHQCLNCVIGAEDWLPPGMAQQIDSISLENQSLAQKIASLTPQQLRVLQMINDGKLNKQIAHELNIQETTIKQHVSSILRKLGVINRTMASVYYQQLQVQQDGEPSDT